MDVLRLTPGEMMQANDVATGSHVLAAKNILDGFGHISVRSQDRPDHFLLARNMAPAQVERSDIHLFDQDGMCLSSSDVRVYLERFIHAKIYRARPDVGAIVHSHSVSVIPFGIVESCKLKPAYHMSAFIGEGLPIFEIGDVVVDSDMLISDGHLGDCLARELGDANGILMRGHGVTVVAADVRRAVFRAIYLELNAAIQMAAMKIGTPRFLSLGEAKAAVHTVEGQVDRAWNLWVSDLAPENHTSSAPASR